MIPLVSCGIEFLTLEEIPLAPDTQISRIEREGFFFLKIPEELKQQLQPAIDFTLSFRHDPHFQSVAMSPRVGFWDVKGIQQVLFYCSSKVFFEHLPEPVAQYGAELSRFSKQVLQKLCDRMGEGCEEESISTNFSFNSYDPQIESVGAPCHQDNGAINLLYQLSDGLEGYIYRRWRQIHVTPDYFCVILGRQMQEKFGKERISLLKHRVPQQYSERGAIAFFAKLDQ